MKQVFKLCVLAVVAAALAGTGRLSADVTPEEQAKLDKVDEALQKVAKLFRDKKYKEAGVAVKEAESAIEALGVAPPKDELEAREKKLVSLQGLIEKATAEKPKPTPRPIVKNVPKTKANLKNQPMASTVSFTKDVAPILVGKCGNCHVRNARGGFSMSTYDALIKGSDAGVVFQPGKADGSRFMELIVQGDMPRGGSPLSEMEQKILATWINEGAKPDEGMDKAANITSLVPGAQAAMTPTLPVVQAGKDDKVMLVRDLVKVMSDSCMNCHGGNQPPGRLSLETFAQISRGGDSGAIIVPGKPKDSLLIQKLRGTAKDGQRMPRNAPPLPEAVIAQFEQWITDGAKFDGKDKDQSLDLAYRILVASKMSHDELAKMRVGVAQQNWRLGLPDMSPDQIETDNFLVLGNIGPVRLREVADAADAVCGKLKTILKPPASQPFVKGRITLFVFDKRIDYSEYGQMVEKRSLPSDMLGHFKYTVIDAYGCVVAPKDPTQSSLTRVLAEDIAGAYIESCGSVPAWFSKGAARVIASKVDLKDSIWKQWDEAVMPAAANIKKVDDLLKSDCTSGDTAFVSYGFAKFLYRDTSRFHSLLDELRRGTDFDKALTKIYRADTNTLLAQWGN